MQYSIFSIPYHGDPVQEEALNIFLRTRKIVAVTKELVTVNNNAYWSFCIRWLVSENSYAKPTKEDPTKNLTKAEFVKYEQLKVIRKKVATELGIPAYAVFTNKELSKICKLTHITATALSKIQGIGSGRIEKIGTPFFKYYEKSQPPVL